MSSLWYLMWKHTWEDDLNWQACDSHGLNSNKRWCLFSMKCHMSCKYEWYYIEAEYRTLQIIELAMYGKKNHFQKRVTWYKNIGPSDAIFFMRRCGRRAQGQPHWNKLRCRVLWPRIGKGRSVKGEGHFVVFFFGHLFMFICWSSMHRNEHFHVGCWVVWLVHTWPYLYHFVLFQLSIHTKLGVHSGFWLWKPWISNFACFPFRLPCVWCRSQKTCWHCRSEPEIS